jgi:hypothetical protein
MEEAGTAYGLVSKKNRFLENVRFKGITPQMGTVGAFMLLVGSGGIVALIYNWASSGFGNFRFSEPLVLFALLIVGGIQIIISAAFISAFRGLYRIVNNPKTESD